MPSGICTSGNGPIGVVRETSLVLAPEHPELLARLSDLASIPRIFWSILRPDGEYAYAAIIHDYLYWEQTDPRKHADDILKVAMEDLEIEPLKITAIYEGVRLGGQAAWDENARLKNQGEKRVLIKEPPTAAMTWAEWKKQPGVFAP